MKTMVKRTALALATLILVVLPLTISFAGDVKNIGNLEGVIKDVETGKPLQNVYVSVDGCNTAAMTNDSGKFFINEIPTGERAIKVLKKGYNAFEGTITVVKKNRNTVTIKLSKQQERQVAKTG